MKRVVVFLLLILGLSGFVSAQSGRRSSSGRTASELPSPSPTPSPDDASNTSDSIPITKQPRSLPSLHGSGDVLPIPSPAPNQTQNQTTNASEKGETAGDDEVLRIETQLVTIPVSIIDRQGNFVTGLEQSDFKIFEDGKEQQVAYFSTTEQPFTVILMLDVSPSTKFKINEIHDAAIAFVNQLKQNDRVMVIAFDERTRVMTEPTNDRNEIAKAIRRSNFGDGTSIYDAVDYVIRRSLSKIEGRKAVVLFSDGVDTTSIRASYQKTVRESEELDAAFYTVYYNTAFDMQSQGGGMPGSGGGGGVLGGILGGVLNGGGRPGSNYPRGGGGGGRGGSAGDIAQGEQYLEDLAAKTGGRKYDADTTANLQTAFYNIAEELRREYSLGYYPNESGNAGQRKQIKVRVGKPNLVVRARDSYVVGAGKTPPASATTVTPPTKLSLN